jgi:hypothetical protein
MELLKFLLSPASAGVGGFSVRGPFILVEPALCALVFLFFGSLVWVWIDAGQRQKNALVVLAFILLTGWPLSFIWWFWLRPPRGESLQSA